MKAADRIDRSTGKSEPDRVGLGTHARRFLLVSIALLVAACSSLKLGYNNADTLLLYTLDSYLDLNERQQALAGERIRRLLDWHRSTQLTGYAQLLSDAQSTLDGRVSAEQVAALQGEMNARLATVGEQAAADIAALALTLTPAQIDRFGAKLAKDSSRARRELLRFAGGRESIDARVKRYANRAESWFGSVTDAQKEILREAVAAQTETWWLDERERRQREIVQLLRGIHDDQPPAEEATRRVRDFFAQLMNPGDDARRAALVQYRRANAELIARMINAATPTQRAALAKKLRGYAEDFAALAAPAASASSELPRG